MSACGLCSRIGERYSRVDPDLIKMFMKKIWKFIGSMKFAITLLLILAAACTGGSFITQGQTSAWYASHYSEQAAAAIILFGLNDVFHSWWFVLITLFLCLNLLLCNVIRLPGLWSRWKNGFSAEKRVLSDGSQIGTCSGDTAGLFPSLGFRNVQEGTTPDGRKYRYAAKNKAGIWGAWICHLGILILIAGFGIGQMVKKEYTVYGVPGQSKAIGDTSYVLTIEDFQIDLRDDDTVEQYTASLTVRDVPAGTSRTAQVSVNHPAVMYGMKFYQNSTGWAANASVEKDGEIIQQDIVCAGEHLAVEDMPGLIVMLDAFYPDYVRDAAGNMSTRSSALRNPGYRYSAFYQGSLIGWNVLLEDDVITIDDYTVRFSDPQPYTLIQIKRDPMTMTALVGGLLIVLGLLLAFYLQPRELWALQTTEGDWQIGARSPKGGALYEEQVRGMLASKPQA